VNTINTQEEKQGHGWGVVK